MPIEFDATFLRKQALRCVSLARTCPHTATSHALEAMSVEWMEIAAELDKQANIAPEANVAAEQPGGKGFVGAELEKRE